jgi:hypothetical protein
VKRKVLLLLIIACLFLTACGINGTMVKSVSAYENLWSVNIGQEGYNRTAESYLRTWQGEGYSLNYSVSPEMYVTVPEEAEDIKYEGMEFFLQDESACWDGIDDDGNWIGGKTHTRSLVWYKDGNAHTLSASTEDESVSLDFISPKTAIEVGGSREYSSGGLEVSHEVWHVEQRSGNIIVTVTLYLKPYDTEIIEQFKQEMQYNKAEEDGFVYYESEYKRTPDDPNFKTLFWETDAGLVVLNGGIPYAHRNDFSSDVWRFINAGLAESITQQIGSRPAALP